MPEMLKLYSSSLTAGMTTLLLATCLAFSSSSAGETTVSQKTGQLSFDEKAPWNGWQLSPNDIRQSGNSEWETLIVNFTSPKSKQIKIIISSQGTGRLAFDNLELQLVNPAGKKLSERRTLSDPGFESVFKTASSTAPAPTSAWKLIGFTRSVSLERLSGKSGLLFTGKVARASQKVKLPELQQFRLMLRVRGKLTSGQTRLAIINTSDKSLLGEIFLTGSTLVGGKKKSGLLSSSANGWLQATRTMEARAGRNHTLQLLLRGSLDNQASCSLTISAPAADGSRTILAHKQFNNQFLGPDWRPLRLNFSLRGTGKFDIAIKINGQGLLEVDNLKLRKPLIIPQPVNFTRGDAENNFRPKSVVTVISSNGKKDAKMVAAFFTNSGLKPSRSVPFWQFWRSAKAFVHLPTPFQKQVLKTNSPPTIWLLNAARGPESKWLAGRAMAVPDKPGSYAISVNAKDIVVGARDPAGFMAAASTLAWMVSDAPAPEIFACRIEDWPANNLRGMHFELPPGDTVSEQTFALMSRYKLGTAFLSGQGAWLTAEPLSKAGSSNLAARADARGISSVPFLDCIGAAPELANRSPQSLELQLHKNEPYILRGTEKNYLLGQNVVLAAGAAVEVSSPDGNNYTINQDYKLAVPSPFWGAKADKSRRSVLRRIATGKIPDGARVLLSYNVLPPSSEIPAACPRSAEAIRIFEARAKLLGAGITGISGIGLGGILPRRMRTDMRTTSTRLKNGRQVADRLRELMTTAALVAEDLTPYAWADMVNPCANLPMPEDSPSTCSELLEVKLRRKLGLLVRIGQSHPAALQNIKRSTVFMLGRSYNLIGWCGDNPAAAEKWAAAFASWSASSERKKAGQEAGKALGLVMGYSAPTARLLSIERFSQAAWSGKPLSNE
jgi:Glycosyl hydrolase family 20, domain 2